MALLKANTGIGTTNPTSALHVFGDGILTGVVTATTFNGQVNAGVSTLGISTAIDLTSQQLNVSGFSTFLNTINVGGSIKDFYGNVGVAGSVLISTGAGVSWSNIGASGVQGIQGIQGTDGTQGTQGITGTGTQGIQGIEGSQGTQGTQGIQGIQGPQGTQGIQGIQGPQGTDGTQGIQGPQGPQGIDGTQGIQGIQGTIDSLQVYDGYPTSRGTATKIDFGSNLSVTSVIAGICTVSLATTNYGPVSSSYWEYGGVYDIPNTFSYSTVYLRPNQVGYWYNPVVAIGNDPIDTPDGSYLFSAAADADDINSDFSAGLQIGDSSGSPSTKGYLTFTAKSGPGIDDIYGAMEINKGTGASYKVLYGMYGYYTDATNLGCALYSDGFVSTNATDNASISANAVNYSPGDRYSSLTLYASGNSPFTLVGRGAANEYYVYTNDSSNALSMQTTDLSGNLATSLDLTSTQFNAFGGSGNGGVTLSHKTGASTWTSIFYSTSTTLQINPPGAGTAILLGSSTVSVTGNLSVSGSLSKGSGSFKIDHPLPEKEDTHYLVHSFIEGPQADLIYRGKVNLSNGTASVNIDIASSMTEGTFEVLCRDVQCFTTNETGWTAVRGKVTGNILTIEAQDSQCTDTISWLVIGERKDRHMLETELTDETGKIIVEPVKPVITEGLSVSVTFEQDIEKPNPPSNPAPRRG